MYNSFASLDECYSLGNFDISNNGRLIRITSIEKQLFKDEICKIFLKGKSKDNFNDFVCTDFRLEEKVRKILKLYCYTKEIMNNDNLKMQLKSIDK